MDSGNRFSRPSLVVFAGLTGFLSGALLLWLGSALVGALPLSSGDALVRLPMLLGGDLYFLVAWFAVWIVIGILLGMRLTRHRAHAFSPALLSERTGIHGRKSFTLIELLIVIAVIAVLATVVILVINPGELLKESRDANRLSDMRTLNQAIQLYSEDVGTGMGTSSVLYLSVPDPTATTSAGSACQGLGLSSSSLPAGWTWHCASPRFYKQTDGTGWIPIDFQSASFGSSLGTLPVDPTNSTSSGLYYTYTASGTNFELTSLMESSKYAMGGSKDVESTDGGKYADLYEQGNDLTLEPLDYDPSLAGYWKFDEGSGSTAYDYSGHGNDGQWYGTQAGTSGYYSTGHNQTWAGTCSTSTSDYVSVTSSASLDLTNGITIGAWLYPFSVEESVIVDKRTPVNYTLYLQNNNPGELVFAYSGTNGADQFYQQNNSSQYLTPNQWQYVTLSYAYGNGASGAFYVNGTLMSGGWGPGNGNYSTQTTNNPLLICKYPSGLYFSGLIDDVRIYNRALSASEIQAIYNSEK